MAVFSSMATGSGAAFGTKMVTEVAFRWNGLKLNKFLEGTEFAKFGMARVKPGTHRCSNKDQSQYW
jgi:hypothetical protein